MSSTKSRPAQIIDAEQTAYLDDLEEADPEWPTDVRAVYHTVRDRVFDRWGVEAQEVVEDCGIRSHEVYSRFRHCTGHGIKEFVVYHRLQLAKRLLRHECLTVTDVAFAVGYASSSGFSKTFKRRVGRSPTAFRVQQE